MVLLLNVCRFLRFTPCFLPHAMPKAAPAKPAARLAVVAGGERPRAASGKTAKDHTACKQRLQQPAALRSLLISSSNIASTLRVLELPEKLPSKLYEDLGAALGPGANFSSNTNVEQQTSTAAVSNSGSGRTFPVLEVLSLAGSGCGDTALLVRVHGADCRRGMSQAHHQNKQTLTLCGAGCTLHTSKLVANYIQTGVLACKRHFSKSHCRTGLRSRIAMQTPHQHKGSALRHR